MSNWGEEGESIMLQCYNVTCYVKRDPLGHCRAQRIVYINNTLFIYTILWPIFSPPSRIARTLNVTCNMQHVTILSTPPTSINSPQPPCNPLPLSILQPKRHARRKPARLLSSARAFTFVNKKPPPPTLFSAQKTAKSALDSYKNAYFCGGRRLHRRGQNRGAAVAMAYRSVVFRCTCCSCRFLAK